MAFIQHSPRPSYGHCETFFTESDDQDAFSQQADRRQRERACHREQQDAMAEELSRLTSDEYENDILSHMEFMETQTMPDVSSMDLQTEIQWEMRPSLIDFLIEAHAAFRLHSETLYLTINLLDRYCSRRIVYRKHYQLVGCTALLIAAKYGDRKDRVPAIRELKSMCCSLYDEGMFMQMEWHVLQTLDWSIGHPTVDAFLKIALAEAPMYDSELKHMAKYLCEMSLYYKDFVSTPPSVMARSSLFLARCILGRPIPRQSEWAGFYNSVLLDNLSQKLYRPYPIVAKKFDSPHLSFVSRTLDRFLQRFLEEQALVAVPPPTPPIEVRMDNEMKQVQATDAFAVPHTPLKAQAPGMSYGYMTPPITPENQLAGTMDCTKDPTYHPMACPSTPTPPSSQAHIQVYQQPYAYHHFQPIEPRYFAH